MKPTFFNSWEGAYSKERLKGILEIGRAQSVMLPSVMQPAVNWLIKFVEMHSLLRLLLYAGAVVAAVAMGLTALLLSGNCIEGTGASAVYLFMISTALGKFLLIFIPKEIL